MDLWVDSDEEWQEGNTPTGLTEATEVDNDNEIDTRDKALTHIENFVLSFLTQLRNSLPYSGTDGQGENEGPVPVDENSSCCKKIILHLADRRKRLQDGFYGVRSLSYPRKSSGSCAKSFAQLFRVLDITHEALLEGVSATKRDIYYRDVPLFKSQAVVDRLVDDLAATIGLGRADLNIRATSKGLVSGSALVIHLIGGEIVQVNDSEGTLIAAGEAISHFEVTSDVAWVLIIEKDAIFQTLCHLNLTAHPSMPGRGIMITGKGYPDIATRQLVKTLSDNLPLTVPILALVDGDPYGIDILSVYKFGSLALKHEDGKLAASRVEWAGIWASELQSLNIDKNSLIPISPSDEKKALTMLRRPAALMPRRWKKEIMHMLHTRRKAEIEILSAAVPGPLINALTRDEEQTAERQTESVSLASTFAGRFIGYLRGKITEFLETHA